MNIPAHRAQQLKDDLFDPDGYAGGHYAERKPRIVTCGACGRSWDDSIITSMTPAPSARCPFEAFDDEEQIPADWPVQPIPRDLEV